MGLGGLGALGAALASSLASNALQGDTRQSQGYPSQDSGPGGMLGSILGSLGRKLNEEIFFLIIEKKVLFDKLWE